MEFIIKTLRTLFFSLDKIIYGFIDDVYGLLLQLTRTSVFTEESIHQFSERVYALVGIFMLFKVTISLINYVLNPDDFTDKEKGLGSIVKHVILSLVMIVLVPYIFNEAFELQSIILEENTIMNLIFGSPSDREPNLQASNSSYAESAGQKIQFTIMYAFAQPNYDDFYNDSEYDLADCKVTYAEDNDGNYTFRKTPVFDNVASEDSKFIYALNESCWGVYDPNTDTYVENGESGQLLGAFKSIDSGDVVYQNYAQGVAQQSFNMFFRQDVILAKEADGSRYFVDYKMGISTAVGVGVLYLLLMFCIDIAVRSVKIGFLQMIAPIPILSYCDPKSGKDGMFKKWTSMCVKTYLDLFIRLFALYFGIYVITLIGKFRDVSTGEVVSGWLVSIFMIVGILIFVKKLPEILKETLGLEGGTFKDFKLNPLKRLESDMLGAKQIAGVGAAGLAGAAAFGTNLVASRGRNPFRHLGSAIAGAASASTKGLVGAAKGEKFGKNFSNSYGTAMKNKMSRNDRLDDRVGWGEMMVSRAQQAIGMHTKGEKTKAVNEKLKAIQDSYKSMQGAAVGNDKKNFDASAYNYGTRDFSKYGKFDGIKALDKYLEEVRKTTINRDSYASEAEYLNAVNEQRQRVADLEELKDIRLDRIASGAETTGDTATDTAIRGNYNQMISAAKEVNSITSSLDSSIADINIAAGAKGINGQSKGVTNQVAGSLDAQHAQTVDQYGAKKGQK